MLFINTLVKFLNSGGHLNHLSRDLLSIPPIWGSLTHGQNLYNYRIEDKDFNENTKEGEHQVLYIGPNCWRLRDEGELVMGQENYLAGRQQALLIPTSQVWKFKKAGSGSVQGPLCSQQPAYHEQFLLEASLEAPSATAEAAGA